MVDLSVGVEPFNAEWFQEAKRCLHPGLVGLDAEGVHVGSASVPGATAKPVVDLDVVSKGSAAHLNHIPVKKHPSENPLAVEGYNKARLAQGATPLQPQQSKTERLPEEGGPASLSFREVANTNRAAGESRGF